MSTLQAQLQDEDDVDLHSLPQVMVSDKQKRIPFITAVLPALLVVIFSGGLALGLPVWLCIHQARGLQGYKLGVFHAIKNGTFVVDESYAVNGGAQEAPLRGLILSSLAARIISFTSSFLMALVAYCVASQWIEESRRTNQPARTTQDQNLTPMQYGLLLGILGAPSITSIFKAIQYTRRGRSRRSNLPVIFVEPLIIATTLLLINYASGLGDLWLHVTTRSTVATLTYEVGSSLNFGVALNDSLCSTPEPSVSSTGMDCLIHPNGWAAANETDWVMPASWPVLYNVSTAPFRVVTLADQKDAAAMVSTVPQALGPLVPSSYIYGAPTIAVRSACNVITANCGKNKDGQVTDCSTAGAPYLPLKWSFMGEPQSKWDSSARFPNRIFGVINGQTGSSVDSIVQVFDPNIMERSGVMTLGMQLQLSQANSKAQYRIPREGVVDSISVLYATCQIEYFNGTIAYDPGSDKFTVTLSSYVSPELGSVLWGPLISQYGTDRLIADISPTMADPLTSPSETISSNLARIALGLLGGIMRPVEADRVVGAKQGVLGLYPVAPVLCVAGLLYVYTFIALVILFASVSLPSYTVVATPNDGEAQEGYRASAKMERAIVLGQMWLTNPLPLIASVFAANDGRDAQRSVAGNSLDMIVDREGSADRLEIGITEIGDGMRFGLRRRSKAVPDHLKLLKTGSS